jgi:hypothetical protein
MEAWLCRPTAAECERAAKGESQGEETSMHVNHELEYLTVVAECKTGPSRMSYLQI